MKTITLNLKNKILIVESDELALSKEGIIHKDYNEHISDLIEGKFHCICPGSELTEEIAKELVKNGKINNLDIYYNYKDDCWLYENKTALESFISAIESKGYGFGKVKFELSEPNNQDKSEVSLKFKHTFNPEKTLIFEIL